jgi:hypothetical protein
VGKGASNLTAQTQAGELADSNSLVQLAQGQAANASTLFNSSLPGFQSAENFYSSIASGDPYAISKAISPAAQAADTAAASAKGNILQNGPAGGEKNLALEQVDVNRGAQVGSTASQSYLNSFNSLAGLAGQGIGESQSATSAAMSGYNGASSGFSNVGNQAIQQKGQTLGAFGSLGTDASTLGGAALGAGGWGSLFSK